MMAALDGLPVEPQVCDFGTCDKVAIVEAVGESGRSWRGARGCAEHAQRVVDYAAKPVEQWRDDYELRAVFDHATRQWVPVGKDAP